MNFTPQMKQWMTIMGTFMVTALGLSTLITSVFGIGWLAPMSSFVPFLAALLLAGLGAAYLVTRFWYAR